VGEKGRWVVGYYAFKTLRMGSNVAAGRWDAPRCTKRVSDDLVT